MTHCTSQVRYALGHGLLNKLGDHPQTENDIRGIIIPNQICPLEKKKAKRLSLEKRKGKRFVSKYPNQNTFSTWNIKFMSVQF